MEPITKSLLHTTPEDSQANKSRVILLRHANSEFNFQFTQLEGNSTTEQDYRFLRSKAQLRDAPLSQLGLQQCEKAQSLANSLNVEVIVVSPLRRAMETAYHVFKNHSNFDQINFILLPKLREALDTTCDIPNNILDTIEEFKGKFKSFDYSRIFKYLDVPHFFLEEIPGEVSAKIMKNKVSNVQDPLGSNAFDLLIEEIDRNYPNKTESIENMTQRIHKAKKSIGNILSTKMNDNDSKIVVVGHSNYFKYWTAKWDKPITEYDIIPEPTEFKWLENCEFYSDFENFPSSNNFS